MSNNCLFIWKQSAENPGTWNGPNRKSVEFGIFHQKLWINGFIWHSGDVTGETFFADVLNRIPETYFERNTPGIRINHLQQKLKTQFMLVPNHLLDFLWKYAKIMAVDIVVADPKIYSLVWLDI